MTFGQEDDNEEDIFDDSMDQDLDNLMLKRRSLLLAQPPLHSPPPLPPQPAKMTPAKRVLNNSLLESLHGILSTRKKQKLDDVVIRQNQSSTARTHNNNDETPQRPQWVLTDVDNIDDEDDDDFKDSLPPPLITNNNNTALSKPINFVPKTQSVVQNSLAAEPVSSASASAAHQSQIQITSIQADIIKLLERKVLLLTTINLNLVSKNLSENDKIRKNLHLNQQIAQIDSEILQKIEKVKQLSVTVNNTITATTVSSQSVVKSFTKEDIDSIATDPLPAPQSTLAPPVLATALPMSMTATKPKANDNRDFPADEFSDDDEDEMDGLIQQSRRRINSHILTPDNSNDNDNDYNNNNNNNNNNKIWCASTALGQSVKHYSITN